MNDYLLVITKQKTFKISVLADIEQDGTLIKFFVSGIIELIILTEDFLFCERVQNND